MDLRRETVWKRTCRSGVVVMRLNGLLLKLAGDLAPPRWFLSATACSNPVSGQPDVRIAFLHFLA
ncbi:MAG TPA: hypothetical protein VFD64_07890 [Gemmatimonadaceae bacterium]|nr:hypothetical protein [Gemmatimonadaceae bacterium]